MAETITVQNGLFKPEIWSKELTRLIMNYGVMLDCVNRNWEGEIKNAGDTVHIQQIGRVKVNTHDDDTAITYQNLDGTSQTLVVDQKKNFGFKVSDIDKVQANIELNNKYLNQAKKEVAEVKDAYLHALGMAGVATDNQLGTVAVTEANIYKQCTTLYRLLARANAIDANGKGVDGKNPFLILPPEIVEVIRNSDKATQATNLGDNTIRKGTIMQFAGFDIKQSTIVEDNSGFAILAGTSEAITFAEQVTKVETIKDKDFFGDFVRGLYVYGAKVVQPTCLASATFTIS